MFVAGTAPLAACSRKRVGEEAGDSNRKMCGKHFFLKQALVSIRTRSSVINVNVSASDARQIELLSQDRPCFSGIQ